MTVTLRDYQQTAIANVMADWRHFKRLLLMSATGTGKTVMMLAIIHELLQRNPDERVLIIAHREELIRQPIERAMSMYPDIGWRMGIVMADINEWSKQIIVATVQTLNNGDRMERLQQHGVDTIIIDEAHHGVADSYVSIVESFPNARLLGLTATPMRTDNLALSEVFEKVSFKFSIQDAIKAGALVPFKPFGFSVPVTMPDNWEPRDNGTDNKTGDLLSAENVLEIVYQKWSEFARERQTIGFTSGVRQAHMTAAYFSAQGIPSAAIDGTTNRKERAAILRQFKAGELQCLWNCQVLTEGFDAPETGCIVMVAPTRSDLVYVQRLGRGLRKAEGKTDCIVLDFAPMGNRNLVMAGDVLDGVPKRVKEVTEKAEDAGVMLYGLTVNDFGEAGYIDPDDVKATVLDYLNKHKLAWTFDGVLAAATVSDSHMICIVTPERERVEKADSIRRGNGGLTGGQMRVYDWIQKYRLFMVEKLDEGDRYRWMARLEGEFSSIAAAKEQAEVIAMPLVDSRLAGKRAHWRNKAMSEAQANFLKRLGGFQEGLTMGQAGQRISYLLAAGAVKRETARIEKEMTRMA